MCTSLASINFLEDGKLLSIGSNAFQKCNLLTNITIPRSVKSVGTQLFRLCQSSPLSIDVDANNQHYKSIDGNLYTKDGKELILYCKGKQEKSFVIPDGVTSIGDYVFNSCTSLESVTLPNSVTSIGKQAFYSCELLASITIPDSVTSIGSTAFSGCTSLVNIEIPNGVTEIRDSVFQYCSSLTSIVIPDSVISIGKSAFYGIAITSIIIPDSVTSIGEMAFDTCYSLTSITIGKSVTNIGRQAFYQCGAEDTIIFNGTVEQWNAIEKGVNWHSREVTYVQCTDGQVTL
jgi:hypothetical protein